MRCAVKEHTEAQSKIYRLELPRIAYDSNTPTYLSAEDAKELSLDSMRSGSSRLATLRISERNDSSPPFAASMVSPEDKQVPLRWVLMIKVKSKSVALKWPTAIGRDAGRAALFGLVRDYAGQASIDDVWQQRPSFPQTWPKTTEDKPSDVSEQARQSGQLASRGRHTRWHNAAKGMRTCSLFNEQGNDYRQNMPLHSSRESRYISLAIDAQGGVWYAHRSPNDWTSPLDWKRYDGEKSKALLHLINVYRRLYGLDALPNFLGPGYELALPLQPTAFRLLRSPLERTTLFRSTTIISLAPVNMPNLRPRFQCESETCGQTFCKYALLRRLAHGDSADAGIVSPFHRELDLKLRYEESHEARFKRK